MRVALALCAAVGLSCVSSTLEAQPARAGRSQSNRATQGSAPASSTSPSDARTLITRGDYAQAKTQLERRRDPESLLLLARLDLLTGDYAGVERTVRAIPRGAFFDRAQTILGEMNLRRGQLDDAERTLRAAASQPNEWRARVVLGELLHERGRGTDAEPFLMDVIEAYNNNTITQTDAEGLSYVGRAARLLGSFQDANDAFREGTRAEAARVETQLEWAKVFLQKYDTGHAEECVRDALQAEPKNPDAHALMARIRVEQSLNFVEAEKEIDQALAANPVCVDALLVRANIALHDANFDRASSVLNQALTSNPNDLRALTLKAAVAFVQDDTRAFESAKRAVFTRNPSYSEFYQLLSDFADWEHRYSEIVAMTREAVRLNPDDYVSLATLGLNLLRLGEEQEGLEVLHRAWDRDHYNVLVYNTLNFYDDVIATQYTSFDAAPFVFRMQRDEKPMLERYAVPHLRRAYADMVRRYGVTPAGPIHIELFADPQHFAIRTAGLPQIGVQGVCFGKVVTAISPRGGPFNWGQIIWHELAHVFHLQLSRNRVPRWFTEGLAEYETIIARPEWKREDDPLLRSGLEHGELPPIRDLNFAFTHARSAQDMTRAYYMSSQVVAFIAQRFGFDKLVAMLRLWAESKASPEVIQTALGISIDELDTQFRASLTDRFRQLPSDYFVELEMFSDLPVRQAAVQAHPDDVEAMAALAAAQLAAGNADAARQQATATLARSATQPLAHYVLMALAVSARDPATVQTHANALIAGGHDSYEVRLLLARLAKEARNVVEARSQLQAAIRINPEQVEAYEGLAELATEAHDDSGLIEALTHVVAIDQHDAQSAKTLLRLQSARSNWAEVIRIGDATLLLDPHDTEVHSHLGRAYLASSRASDALFEYESALMALPSDAVPQLIASMKLDKARAFVALNRRQDAQRMIREALQADPSRGAESRTILQTRPARTR